MKHKMVALEAHVIILILYIFSFYDHSVIALTFALSFFFYLCILPEKFHWNWN